MRINSITKVGGFTVLELIIVILILTVIVSVVISLAAFAVKFIGIVLAVLACMVMVKWLLK